MKPVLKQSGHMLLFSLAHEGVTVMVNPMDFFDEVVPEWSDYSGIPFTVTEFEFLLKHGECSHESIEEMSLTQVPLNG